MNNPLRILIVDDEPDILEFLSYNLKKFNYEVHKAINGVDALQQVKNHHQDLLLIDIRMPVMNGLELCEEVRKIDEYKDTPILFLSANRSEFTFQNVLAAGGNTLINKPILPSKLIKIIKDYLPE